MQTSSLGRHRCDAVPHKDLHDIPNLCPISWMVHAHCAASPAADSARPSRVNAPPERHRKGHLLHVQASLGLVGDQRAHAQRGALRAVPVNVRERRAGHRKRSGCVPEGVAQGPPPQGLPGFKYLSASGRNRPLCRSARAEGSARSGFVPARSPPRRRRSGLGSSGRARRSDRPRAPSRISPWLRPCHWHRRRRRPAAVARRVPGPGRWRPGPPARR